MLLVEVTLSEGSWLGLPEVRDRLLSGSLDTSGLNWDSGSLKFALFQRHWGGCRSLEHTTHAVTGVLCEQIRMRRAECSIKGL